jgi:formylglycine-generating enzyme required for sulfatase activity
VALGEKIIKGTGTVSVVSGEQNGWGLKNYIGNVQEWVMDDGGGVKARGGAFEDSFSNCEISLERPHNGSSDDATGFRLVLEMG